MRSELHQELDKQQWSTKEKKNPKLLYYLGGAYVSLKIWFLIKETIWIFIQVSRL